MPFTRRRFLRTAAALGLSAYGAGVFAQQTRTALQPGPYRVERAILGVAAGTTRVPVPEEVPFSSQLLRCRSGVSQVVRPDAIAAAVYHPVAPGRYPLILYAHAKRTRLYCPEDLPPVLDRSYADHTRDMLRGRRLHTHLASHGFVVVVPDLGWLMHMFEGGAWDAPPSLARTRLLVALFEHLQANPGWFDGRIDASRLALFGHSTGGSACMAARQRLPHAKLLGLLAPAAFDFAPRAPEPPPLTVVIAGTRDTSQGVRPDLVFEHSPRPRVLVTVHGANHLGYTELCSPSNRVCADLDTPGQIARDLQQDAAAAYLGAAARLALRGEEEMRALLEGKRALDLPVQIDVRAELAPATG
jgi:predicted dienelactone hydrolase